MSKLKTIACAISGGVDSAVSALLLKQRGFNVIGVFMTNWDVPNEIGHCSLDDDFSHATYVCDKLDIPLHRVNFVKEYWNNVFTDLIDGYGRGISPNPDVLCNKYVKFGAFLSHATRELGADAIATGHYAQNSAGNFLQRIHQYSDHEDVNLLSAVDPTKDQTLFLSQMSQRALRLTMFPVGGMLKSHVKQLAADANLHRVLQKKESAGICFIGRRNFSEFISDYIDDYPGEFVHIETGQVISEHNGKHHWTLGQRILAGGLNTAYYVANINAVDQRILVAPGSRHPTLFFRELRTEPVHWISPGLHSTDPGSALLYRFQHTHPLASCRVAEVAEDGSLRVLLGESVRALNRGQYVVFYSLGGDVCLGSARIVDNGLSDYERATDAPSEVVASSTY